MYMSNVTVDAVSNKQNVFETKYGPAYNFSFKVGDDWYVLPFTKAGTTPFGKGSVVSFKFNQEQNGQYTNNKVDKKTLEIGGAGAPVQATAPQATGRAAPVSNAPNSQRNTGITVGMAINNAVSILGDHATIENIHKKAWEIIKLSDQMNTEVAAGKCPFETDAPADVGFTESTDGFSDDIPF